MIYKVVNSLMLIVKKRSKLGAKIVWYFERGSSSDTMTLKNSQDEERKKNMQSQRDNHWRESKFGRRRKVENYDYGRV